MNSTLAFTLMLLSLMFGAVVVSASWGYALGREALKGITQPDVRPPNTVGDAAADASEREDLIIIPEQTILDSVKARMSGQPVPTEGSPADSDGQSRAASTPTAIAPDDNRAEPDESLVSDVSFVESSAFPLVAQDQGVTLEVYSTRRQGETLFLDISIQNQSGIPVQVLDQFLRLTTDDGGILGSNVDGVPSEIQPGAGPFMGVVSVPAGRLQQGDRLSLTWSNSSGQNLHLQIADIPVL